MHLNTLDIDRGEARDLYLTFRLDDRARSFDLTGELPTAEQVLDHPTTREPAP